MKVALLAADPTIEDLVAELITYAGYEPVRGGPATGGNDLHLAAAPIAMLDVCLPTTFLRDSIADADSIRTTVVFFGSSVAPGTCDPSRINGARGISLCPADQRR